MDKTEDINKEINQNYLVIGGGSGEHPALIINNDAVLFKFLSHVKEIDTPDIMDNDSKFNDYDIYQLSEKINDKYFKGNDDITKEILNWSIDKNQWPLKTFLKVAEKYNKNIDNLESTIQDAIALFIINEMPLEYAIKDDDLLMFAKLVKLNQWSNVFDNKDLGYLFKGFSGVLNCQKYGKIIKDDKVVWGYDLKDWISDNINNNKNIKNKIR